jgi:hypothetical protein
MGRNCEMKFSYENLYKHTPKTYIYEVIKNKIRETYEKHYFEFNIRDIMTKEKLREVSCRCDQPENTSHEQLKFFAMESYSRTKKYFDDHSELLL